MPAALLFLIVAGIANAAAIAVTPGSFTLSNTIIDIGQSTTANTVVSGGTGPYTGAYTFIPVNSAGNNVNDVITGSVTPFGMAFTPSGALEYVVYSTGAISTVNVISPATNTVVKTIGLVSYTANNQQSTFAINPQGTLAYVAMGQYTVNVINIATNTVVNSISMGATPSSIAFNPQGTLAYVVIYSSGIPTGTVNVINVATNTVVNTIVVGIAPVAVAVNPQGTLAYVINQGSNTNNPGTVNVINTATNTVIKTITVGADPFGIAFNPQGTLAYVTNENSQTVSVINTASNTVASTLNIGFTPSSIALNPEGTLLYITNYTGGMEVINTATDAIVGNFLLDHQFLFAPLAFNPSGSILSSSYLSINSYGPAAWLTLSPPETPIAALPSSNALTLQVTATSSNTLTYTFNGVQGQITTSGSNTTYGTWTAYAFAQDSATGDFGFTGLTGTNAIVSTANTFTINPQLSAGQITPSNPSINSGQSVLLSANPSGGTTPYAYQWYAISGTTAPTCTTANQIAGATSSTYLATPASANSYAYQVTDSATTNVIMCSPGTTVTISKGAPVGGSGGATSQQTTATTVQTTVATTAALQNNTQEGNGTVSNSTPLTFNFFGNTLIIKVSSKSNSAENVKLLINDITENSPPAPAGYSKVRVFNISASAPSNSLIYAKSKYNCTTQHPVSAFSYNGNSWNEIESSINTSSCTISFAAPGNATIGIFQNKPPATTSSSPANNGNAVQSTLPFTYAIIAAIIIIIIVAAYLFFRSRK